MAEHDTEQFTRVYHQLRPIILLFAENRGMGNFSAEELRQWVRSFIPLVAPGSPCRILRALKDDGLLNYACIERSLSLYQFLPLGAVIIRPQLELPLGDHP